MLSAVLLFLGVAFASLDAKCVKLFRVGGVTVCPRMLVECTVKGTLK